MTDARQSTSRRNGLLALGLLSALVGCDKLGLDSGKASHDCPSFEVATKACNQQGHCWSVYERSGDEMVAVAVGKDSESGSGKAAAACNIKCEPCAAMAEAAATPDPQTELERAALSYAQQLCDHWFRCEPYWARRSAGEKAACVSSELALLLFDSKLPGAQVDTASVMRCASDLSVAECSDRSICFEGTGNDNDSCLVGWQCTSGYCTGTGWQCGVCAAKPSPGSTCSDKQGCGDNLYCSGGVCASYGDVGQSCSKTRPCAAYHSCLEGKCVADDARVGESCGPEVHRPYCNYLDQVLGCDDSTHVCREATVALPGEPCPTFGWCGAAGACFEGVCRAGPGPNEPCNTEQTSLPCRWPYLCVNGTCRGQAQASACGG